MPCRGVNRCEDLESEMLSIRPWVARVLASCALTSMMWVQLPAQSPNSETATAIVSFQLYSTPPRPIPFFPFLLSSPAVMEGETVERNAGFRINERREIDTLGERSLWLSVESDGRRGWVYAGPANAANDYSHLWSHGGIGAVIDERKASDPAPLSR